VIGDDSIRTGRGSSSAGEVSRRGGRGSSSDDEEVRGEVIRLIGGFVVLAFFLSGSSANTFRLLFGDPIGVPLLLPVFSFCTGPAVETCSVEWIRAADGLTVGRTSTVLRVVIVFWTVDANLSSAPKKSIVGDGCDEVDMG
jgi:hypothetical protein